MKTKLTLSISGDRVRKIKSYSSRRKKSVSQFFEEVIDGLGDIQETKGKKVRSIDLLDGLLTDKFTKENLKNDARLARILGQR